MKRSNRQLPLLLLPILILSACAKPGAAPAVDPKVRAEAARLASVQLGQLEQRLTDQERTQVLDLLEQLVPLRQTRAQTGRWALFPQEEELVGQLNQLYEDYTQRYLEEPEAPEGEEDPPALARYDIGADGGLTPVEGEDSYRPLWDQVRALLPEGSLDAFQHFTVFTDGPDNILAYVVPADEEGVQWELAVDAQDTEDPEEFTETVYHEYAHYLTLNDKQVTYGAPKRYDCYGENDLVSNPDSYLNAFYQRFWKDYLDDRLADPESINFYLRHEDDFITSYAATSPSEDIAECFSYFVLYDKPTGTSVWEQKQNFFYDYPELVAFRDQARAKLGL
ncbi:hypothetical protein B5E56_12680 [Flavonifractor sp. An112]|uniref:hypothetical protein n=1 Tax=Flavonifractor sp. An112 TaxID=1965544 RepID=UPI000B383631|nr:hypothetical protein [Flavonifractor sp. An112]OUQ56505.1 hypothetical protein B5E56_12680 [Flavonifractor sp. An112]